MRADESATKKHEQIEKELFLNKKEVSLHG